MTRRNTDSAARDGARTGPALLLALFAAALVLALAAGRAPAQSAGTHTLTLTIVGKNPAATNHYAGLDVLRFER